MGPLGVNPPSENHLSGYLGKFARIAPIIVDLAIEVAGGIEEMGKGRLPVRKESTT